MSEEITIILNGEPHSLDKGASLADIVVQLGLGDSRYAIEVNEEIVPRSEHQTWLVSAQDKVEIVQAIGGG